MRPHLLNLTQSLIAILNVSVPQSTSSLNQSLSLLQYQCSLFQGTYIYTALTCSVSSRNPGPASYVCKHTPTKVWMVGPVGMHLHVTGNHSHDMVATVYMYEDNATANTHIHAIGDGYWSTNLVKLCHPSLTFQMTTHHSSVSVRPTSSPLSLPPSGRQGAESLTTASCHFSMTCSCS